MKEIGAILLASVGSLAAQSAGLLPELVVMAERGGTQPAAVPVLAEWNRGELAAASPRTIDELLAKDPSFSLYRRQTSLFGNPTSSGVSLRNTGATAASRTLVLLDGIPQNDPFGGWVYWARYEPSALESVRIIPAAQSVVWGSQSPAGVVQLAARSPFEQRGVLRLGGGAQGTYGGSFAAALPDSEQTLALGFSAFALHSDGFFVLARPQRGPIDRRLDIDSRGGDAKLAWRPAAGVTVESGVSYYADERGNGTPLARNESEAVDFSLRVSSEEGALGWQALAYHQRREFSQVFSTVNAARDAEILALDQFDVPGRGTGGAFTLLWEPAGRWSLTAGVDARHLSGATHEQVGLFRLREAGGEQTLAGIFATARYRPDDPATRIDASLRADGWWLDEGRRIEDPLAGGARLREEIQDDRSGFEPSAAVALSRALSERLEAHLSTGTGFRLPSLNELHRPFRVRNDIVEANPDLDPERFFSLQTGLEWRPAETLVVSGSLFHHWIRDAIANVPVTDPAQIAGLFGTIPPGGSGSQRQNVEEARVPGAQGEIAWQALEKLTLRASGIWTDAEFRRSSRQPLLEGQPFPQAPDLRLIGSLAWEPLDGLTVSAGYEYGSQQFDDALAERRIPSYSSVALGASWRRGKTVYQARIDNLFDEEIATGLSSNGLLTLAAPRSFWLSLEREF
jgi:outer membrane receptor protein involved in Fe transport